MGSGTGDADDRHRTGRCWRDLPGFHAQPDITGRYATERFDDKGHDMNTIRFQSREAFIDALEARRSFWREFDKRQEREHKAAEKQWLTTARATLRDAVKWDYDRLKKSLDYNGELRRLDTTPKCPVLREPAIDRVLAALKLTQSKSFVVDTQGAWASAHDLLTADPDARTKVC